MVDQFKEFEEKRGLLIDKVDEFYYWIYIRFNVYMKLEEVVNHQIKLSLKNPKFTIRDLFYVLRNLTYNNPLLYRKHNDILFFTHARRIYENRKYICPYTDRIAEQFKDKAISAEFIYKTKHFRPYYTNRLLELDYVDFHPLILIKLFRIFYEKKYKFEIIQLRNIAQKLNKDISREFGVELGTEFYSNLLVKRFFWFKMKKKILKKLIKKISPKIIVEVVGYETNKMIINEVSYELGITTIELQHGVIGRGHIAYNYLVNRKYKQLPEYMFYYSDYWKNTCNYPICKDKQITTGYPYMEEQMQKNVPHKKNSENMKVLVLSQPEFSVKLKKLIKEVAAQIQSQGVNIEFIYKLHPSEYSIPVKKWNELLEYSNIRLIHDSSRSLYSLFAEADIQIGVTSTAVFEGLAYHLKTYIYHLEKTDTYMKDLRESGAAIFFDTSAELCQMILTTDKKTEADLDLNNKFFVKNALKNIICEIQKVVDKS